MKKTIGAILFFFAAVVVSLVWLYVWNPSHGTIAEAPHPQIDSLLTNIQHELDARNFPKSKRLALYTLDRCRRENYRNGEIRALRKLGYVLIQEAKYDSSIKVLKQAQSLNRTHLSDLNLTAKIELSLSSAYLWQGHYHQAQQYLESARSHYEKSGNKIGIAETYNQEGLVYALQAKFDQAQRIWEAGLPVAREAPGDRYYERSMLGNLGILYRKTGQIDRAVPRIQQSLKIGREMGDRRAQSVDLTNLGDIQFMRGNFQEALKLYSEALRLKEEVGEIRLLLNSYSAMALTYDALNDFRNAEYYYRKGIDVIEQKLHGDFHRHAHLYQGFGRHWLRRGEPDRAAPYLQKAIEGFRATNSREYLIDGYLALAELNLKQGKLSEALQHSAAAVALAEEIHSIYLPYAYLNLGLSHYNLKDQAAALASLKKAVEYGQWLNQPDALWQAHDYLARCYSESDDLLVAAGHAERAIVAIEQLRRFTISPELSSRFLADKMQVYKRYFDILFQQYQRQPSDKILSNLFVLSEQTRGRVLLESLNSGMESIFSQLQQSSVLQHLEEQIVSVNLFIRKELTKSEQEQRTDLIKSWRKKLASLQREFDLQTTQFVAAHPELSTMIALNRIPSPERIQNHIPKNTALLSYYASEEALYAFVIDPNRVHLMKLPINTTELWEKIKKLRQPFQDLKEGKIDFLRLTFDAELSHDLYNKLMAPLGDFLGGRSHLIIIPSAALHYLPFELLVLDKKSDSTKKALAFSAYAQYRYLLERYTVSYLPATTLLPLLRDKKAGKPQHTLLAFGNPIFAKAQSEPVRLAEASLLTGLRNMLLTPLPGASLEVQKIADMFNSKDVVAFTESSASESAYKREAARFRFIHFATHGYVDQRNPNFSALLLNPGDAKEDGFLYSYEIYVSPLNAELVSMSACETALGEYRESEGLVSFVQAFFAAGSHSVLASLWSVEEAAYPLMVSFYENMQNGMPKAEALRQAKLAFMSGSSYRDQQTEYAHIHPFLWAPFVFYGYQ